jgi:hypothetical protein
MTGKATVKNLQNYIEPYFPEIPVYTFDQNQTRNLPCIVIGYDDEDGELSYLGNYTVKTWVSVAYQGYDDPDNNNADSTARDVMIVICNKSLLLSAMNKPTSGTDIRPLTGFGLYDISFPSIKREEEDHSTVVHLDFEFYTVACDL